MPFNHSHWVAVILGVWYSVLFIITYITSAARGNLYTYITYISDTGNKQPESCIFTIGLTVGSALMFVVSYIRYGQIRLVCGINNPKWQKLEKWNEISFYVSITASLGVLVIGAVQVSVWRFTHIIAATIAFNCAVFFLSVQTYIAIQIYPEYGTKISNAFKLFLNVIAATALSICFFAGVTSYALYPENDSSKWSSRSDGYEVHIVNVGAEWALALSIIYYLTSYALEFKNIKIYSPVFELTDN